MLATILLVENPFILSPILFPGHYDPITSFEPLCYVAATPAVLAVSSQYAEVPGTIAA